MADGFETLADFAGRWRAGKWGIYILEVMAVVLTLTEFGGVTSKGFRFLGQYGTRPSAMWAMIAGLTALAWLACLVALLRKRPRPGSWLHRPPFYSDRARLVAFGVLIINAVVTLVLFLGILRYDVVHAAPPAPGQLGVAVAAFGEGPEMKESSRGRELSALVARSLRADIDQLPGLAGRVTIVSVPLIQNEAEALRVAQQTGASLVIWGWVAETVDDTLVPSFTFVESSEGDRSAGKVPPWYEVEISGGGTLELSHSLARRTSGLIDYVLGLVYLNQADYSMAAERFQEAISLTEEELQAQAPPEHAVRSVNRTLAIYHLALGRTYAALADPVRALEEYEVAVESDPSYGPVFVGLGNLDYQEGRCAEALRWYEQAIRLSPPDKQTVAYYSTGNAHFCLGEYEAAAYSYERAIKLARSDDRGIPLYHLVLGVTLCQMGRYAEGVGELDQARSLSERGTKIYADAATEQGNCQTDDSAADAPVDTPTPFPTPAPTQTPTRYPKAAVTQTVTSFLTPSSTADATAMPSETPPTATPTVELIYHAPSLIAPMDGEEFWEGDRITIRWRPIGTLLPDAYYVVTLSYLHQGRTAYTESPWSKDTTWTLSEYDDLLSLCDDGEFHWLVQVMLQTGVDASGNPAGTPLSPVSQVWTFIWRAVSGTETVEPALTATPFPTATPTLRPTRFPTAPPPTDTPPPPPTDTPPPPPPP